MREKNGGRNICVSIVFSSNRSVRGGTGFRHKALAASSGSLSIACGMITVRLTTGTREKERDRALIATCTLRKFLLLSGDTKSGTRRDRHFANRELCFTMIFLAREWDIFRGSDSICSPIYGSVILYNSITKSDVCRFFVKSKEERMFMLLWNLCSHENDGYVV